MSKRLIGSFLALIGSALLLVACQAIDNSSNSLLGYAARRGSPVTIHFRGARKSHKWRGRGRFRRLITFATPIQHIFIISMENRTVENLFGAYYGQTWNGPGGGFWQDPNNFNLRDPNASPTLKPNSLSKHFNPNHGHDKAWWYDSQGLWSNAPIGCPNLPCPDYATPYSIVPTSETSIYASLVANWAFVNNVLQANQGPSFVAHQYYIAAQSGGIQGSLSSPDAEAENPGNPPAPDPTGNYIDSDNEDLETSGCNPGGYTVKSINMSLPVASPTPLDNGGKISACEEYTSNILDETLQTFGNPPDEDWQYIAHANNSIWAAPLGVAHLWNAYNNGIKQIASFAVDPDAVNFVRNITGGNPTPNPARPIAQLTYITPCEHESDHAEITGNDDGPQWLAWVINAIGQSSYWNSSVILVTWDDWGGWYDNVPQVPLPGPFRPAFNGYNNADDPNEWGFRVPLIVISPYVKQRGYISSQATSGFQYRSQSAIMQYIEAAFGLASLGADDVQNNQNDGLQDVFDFGRQPLPYVQISTPFVPPPLGQCP